MNLVEFFRLTKRQYYADFFITPPLTLVSAVLSIMYGFTPHWFALCAAGILAWTLYEYLIHRFVTHKLWVFKVVHDIHHDHQREFIGTPPVMTLTIYAVLWWFLGIGNSSAFMVGFSAGYVWYSTLHTLFHYARIEHGSWLFGLKRHHALHHAFYNVNYGVSTSLWDRVFRTMK